VKERLTMNGKKIIEKKLIHIIKNIDYKILNYLRKNTENI
jgi:hypothetical protein